MYNEAIKDIEKTIELIEVMQPEEILIVGEQIERIESECVRMVREMARSLGEYGAKKFALEASIDRLKEEVDSVGQEDIKYIFESM